MVKKNLPVRLDGKYLIPPVGIYRIGETRPVYMGVLIFWTVIGPELWSRICEVLARESAQIAVLVK
jgi:hypothetical protein